MRPQKRGPRAASSTPFLGQAVAKYDVDELDDLNKQRSKREDYVAVKRPDGTIAKARGERTFYGAFEGGFSAGYWGTVGSKEGWEPASFTSSRSKRHADAAPRVEDYMDEEDLRDHRSSRKTIATREEFATRELQSRSMGSAALATGVSHDLEEELFGGSRLGSRLLKASIQQPTSEPTASTPSAAPKTKKSYGCAPPPPGFLAGKAAETGGPEMKLGKLEAFHASQAPPMERHLESELERLWQSKTDLHGIGYFMGARGGSQGSCIPSNRRLYMSASRGKNLSKKAALGYSQFGTGVLDQDDYDAWEEVYEHEGDKSNYHAALKDEGEDDGPLLAVEDRPWRAVPGELPGFVKAERREETQSFSRWYPPAVPRQYRGVHLIDISPLQEGQEGSEEHKKLLEFQQKHGQQRLMDPTFRAQLLGEETRSKEKVTAPAFPPEPPKEEDKEKAIQRSTEPLWQAVPDHQKQNLLQALGRQFVMGSLQDMDGKAARHEPFKSDAQKQKRYVKFCMAMEGKAAFSEALKGDQLSEAERELELAEFGRVYRSFRQEHPDADIAKALEEKASQPAPVLRRTVVPWAPDKILCRRWGVAEPRPGGFGDREEEPKSRHQRKYNEQVKAKETGKAAQAEKGRKPLADAAPSLTVAASGELTRPPKSLFTSIFGDDDD